MVATPLAWPKAAAALNKKQEVNNNTLKSFIDRGSPTLARRKERRGA